MTLYHGDCRDVLPTLDAESIDACVTDPPYALTAMTKRFGKAGSAPAKGPAFQRHNAGFMGKSWDTEDVVFDPETWALVLRVLRPGSHLLAFGGTRTYHRLVCAIEDAGFEIRDTITWLYGSGFPKSLDVSKQLDKMAKAPRQPDEYTGANHKNRVYGHGMGGGVTLSRSRAITPAAAAAAGWGTALKPACELICVARKPLIGSVASNWLAHGTGAINIDASRIETDETWEGRLLPNAKDGVTWGGPLNSSSSSSSHPLGRWPANVVLDEHAAVLLDSHSGERPSGYAHVLRRGGTTGKGMGYGSSAAGNVLDATYGDTGGASRFFFTARASRAERSDGLGSRSTHPTVKPLSLMAWLVKLVTPPGGRVLDPFLGSGTTAIAAIGNGFDWVGIEREVEYVQIARDRIGFGCEVVEPQGEHLLA